MGREPYLAQMQFGPYSVRDVAGAHFPPLRLTITARRPFPLRFPVGAWAECPPPFGPAERPPFGRLGVRKIVARIGPLRIGQSMLSADVARLDRIRADSFQDTGDALKS